MSYILDALRKAEAEREDAVRLAQGTAPSIHAPPAPAASSPAGEAPPPSPSTTPLLWAVAGVSMFLAGALAWMLLASGPGADAPLAQAPATAPVGALVMTTPVEQPVSAPLVVAEPSPEPALAPEPAPEQAAAAPMRSEPPATPSPQVREAVPAPTPRAIRRNEVAVRPARAPATTNTPSAAPSTRLYAQNELPESIRRQLPQMTVGGAMYSDNPASRMLILNGQLFREGDHPVPNLKLEQINLKSAVLSYQGYRYAINY